MSFWMMLTPLFSALLGWFLSWLLLKMLFHPYLPHKWLGFTMQGKIPKHQMELSSKMGNIFSREFNLFKEIEEKMLDPLTLQKITPEIEIHIDHFLRVKLKEAMPMVAMFVGDKTIIQLKEVFMTEMEILFPEIMKSYINKLQNDINIAEKITLTLAAVPVKKIEAFFLKTLHKELRYVQLAGGLLGFITGIFQLIIILLLRS